jgi:hypothetical protein
MARAKNDAGERIESLRFSVPALRVGVLEYGAGQLQTNNTALEGKPVKLYYPPEAVGDKDFLKSLETAPVIVGGHDSTTNEQNKKIDGWAHNVSYDTMKKAAMLDGVVKGAKEVAYIRGNLGSEGFGASAFVDIYNLKVENGVTPDGQEYNAIANELRATHVALAPHVRDPENKIRVTNAVCINTEGTIEAEAMNGQLLGTSPSLEMAKKLCADFWYGKPSDITFVPAGANEWDIVNGTKKIESSHIVYKNGRYRFEAKNTTAVNAQNIQFGSFSNGTMPVKLDGKTQVKIIDLDALYKKDKGGVFKVETAVGTEEFKTLNDAKKYAEWYILNRVVVQNTNSIKRMEDMDDKELAALVTNTVRDTVKEVLSAKNAEDEMEALKAKNAELEKELKGLKGEKGKGENAAFEGKETPEEEKEEEKEITAENMKPSQAVIAAFASAYNVDFRAKTPSFALLAGLASIAETDPAKRIAAVNAKFEEIKKTTPKDSAAALNTIVSEVF